MKKQFKIIRSEKLRNKYWQEIDFVPDYANVGVNCNSVVIDTKQTFQTHLGFGGAFTEAACYVLDKAGKKVREQVAKAYFSKDGLRYNLGRMSVHSCDFSLGNYTYINNGNFSMEHEEKWVLPFLREAVSVRGERLTMFLAPWSPPAEFKTNNDMNFGGKLKPEFRQAWAEYLVNTILELKKRGVEIDVVNTQNEPEAVQTWDSCLYTAEEEADFLLNYLFPALDRAKLNTKVIIWDHNRDLMVKRAKITLKNPELLKRVWGVGYHWYVANEHKNLDTLHTLFPNQHILLTEGCVEYSNSVYAHGDFANGERYGRQIIEDFNNFSEGWIDWNLVLDADGGPNHAKNLCESPIMIDGERVIYNPSYYFIGHFSRYIDVGAVRLKCCNDICEDFYSLAYKNPNGNIVVVLQNQGGVREIEVFVDGVSFTITLPNSSITTLLL